MDSITAELPPAHRTERAGHPYWVPALERGLKVLVALSGSAEPRTLTELARETGIQVPNVYRIVYTLQQLGYVETAGETKTYRVTPQILRIGSSYANSRRLVDVARPYLEALLDTVDGACHLAIRDDLELVFLLGVSSDRLPLRPLPTGGRLPLHATALGTVLLSDSEDEEIRALHHRYRSGGGTGQAFETRPQTIEQLLRAVRDVRRTGLFIDRTGTVSGLIAAAAPVFDAKGKVCAAVNILCIDTPGNTRSLKRIWGRELMAVADRISAEARQLPDLIL